MGRINGIDKYDLPNLQYFGVVGNTYYADSGASVDVYRDGKSDYTITSTLPLANLFPETKSNIKQLYLQNNNITTLSGLSGYIGVTFLRCENNELVSLDGLDDMMQLVSLCARGNKLGGTDSAENSASDSYLMFKSSGTISGGTALKALFGHKNLKYLNLAENKYLANCSWLLGCEAMKADGYIGLADLSGCSKSMIVTGLENYGFVSAMGSNLKLPVAIYTSDVFDIEIQDLDYNGSTYSAEEITDLILLNSPLYGNTHITKLNLTGCAQVTNEAWMILLESMPNLEHVKLYNCTKLTNLEWISKANYRESKAWFSNYSVDVNGTAKNVTLGPTFNVGTIDGDEGLSVDGYYYVYLSDNTKSNYNVATGRNYSVSAGETIGTCEDGTTWTSLGPGEPYFIAYKFESYHYADDGETYQYMVNQYDYSYDNNTSYTSTWGTFYTGLNSCTKIVELDIRGTGVRDLTPLNGLITSAKSNGKLDISGQRTLDGDLGTEAISTNQTTSGLNQSTLMTLRISNGSDLKNIVPVINRLSSSTAIVYWGTVRKENISGLAMTNLACYENIKYLKNIQYLFVNLYTATLGSISSTLNLSYTCVIECRGTNIRGAIKFPFTSCSVDLTYTIPNFPYGSEYLTYVRMTQPWCQKEFYEQFFLDICKAPNLLTIWLHGAGDYVVTDLSYLITTVNPNVKTLKLTGNSATSKCSYITSLGGIDYFTNLKALEADYSRKRNFISWPRSLSITC